MNEDEQVKAIDLWDRIDDDIRDPKSSILVALLTIAQRESRHALQQLANLDPMQDNLAKRVMDLQNEIRRFQDLRDWIARARMDGINAFQALNAEDQESLRSILTQSPQTVNDA